MLQTAHSAAKWYPPVMCGLGVVVGLGWLWRAGSSSSLILNHLQALELEARGEVDVGGRVTVFAQAFRSLHFMVRA